MYTIKVDGQVLYAPALSEEYSMVLSPKLELEVNRAGSLTFILPHGHAMRESIQTMKSIITVERDGEEVFRGRVTEEAIDLYDHAEYYCEGELSFLLDSMQRPNVYDCTAEEFFRTLISNHNAQVDSENRFTVGLVTAVDDSDTMDYEQSSYHSTSGEIGNELLNRFGGFLAVRKVGNTRYLDYLESLEEVTDQKIEFSVNMLDLQHRLEAKDIFTVLIPLGRSADSPDLVTIADVNGGSDYIENTSLVNRYGRIVKAHTWDDISDPNELKDAGWEELNKSAIADTLTLTALDMQLLGVDTEKLWVGHKITIVSKEHGISRTEPCMKMTVDMENPENNQYVFGTVPATLADGVNEHTRTLQDHDERIRANEYLWSLGMQYIDEAKKSISNVLLELDALNASILLKADRTEIGELEARLSAAEIKIDGALALIALKADQTVVDKLGERISQAEIKVDGANAAISLNTKRIDTTIEGLTERVTTAEIKIDGANAEIMLKASQEDVDKLNKRVTSAEVDIDGANAAISLKASKTVVEDLEDRVSSAELSIDGLNSEIALKANKIDLQGFVTADDLETEILNVLKVATIENLVVDFLAASQISSSNLDIYCSEITATGSIVADVTSTDTLWATGAHVATLAATDASIGTINGYNVSRASVNVVVNNPEIVKATETITYLDGDGNAQTLTVVTGVALQTSNKTNISYLQLT